MLQKILRESSIYGLATVITRGLNFLLLPLYVRILAPYEIGVYELLNSLSLILAVILPLEITQAVARLKTNIDLNQHDVRRQSATAFSFTLFSFLSFGVITLISFPLLGAKYLDERIQFYVPILAVILLLSNGVYYFLQNELRWSQQSRIYVLATFVSAIVTSSLAIILLLGMNFGLQGLYIALNLGVIAGIVTISFKTPHLIQIRWKWKELRGLLRFSLPLAIASAFIVIASIVDRFVLSYFLNLESLGRYGVSLRVSGLAMLIFQSLQMAILPTILGDSGYNNRKIYLEKTLRFFLIVGFTITLILSAIAPEVYIMIATTSYSGGAMLIPILLIGSVFSAVYPFAPGLWLEGFTWRMAILGMVIAILSSLLSVLLIPVFGELGAGLSYALTGISYASILIIYSDHVYPVARNYSKLIFSSIIYCIGAMLLSFCIDNNISISSRIAIALFIGILCCGMLTTFLEIRGIFHAVNKILFSQKD